MNAAPERRVVDPEVVYEDDRFRVVRLVLQETDRTPIHAHERDELVVTINGCRIRSRDPDDRLRHEYFTEPGDVRFFSAPRDAHYIENAGPGPYVCVVVEPKATQAGRTGGRAAAAE